MRRNLAKAMFPVAGFGTQLLPETGSASGKSPTPVAPAPAHEALRDTPCDGFREFVTAGPAAG